MKQLHFQKTGGLLVADNGDKRFVIDTTCDPVRASVFHRFAKSQRPFVSSTFPTKSLAIDWLSHFYEPNGGRHGA